VNSRNDRRGGRAILWLLGRLGGVVLVIWGAATIGFIALKFIPGDPVDVMLGVQSQVSDETKDLIREDWGLNEPVIAQYLSYLGRLVTADLGMSYQLRQPVADVIALQLPSTLQLTALAVAFALALAAASALFARGRRAGRAVSVLELVVISSPAFWTGLVLIAVFAFGLGWFPVAETSTPRSLVLPALALALPVAGIVSQILRQGLDSAERQPFATSVLARGASRSRLLGRHTLRHAATDSLTISGYLVGSLLGGAVLVETVFARPGLGRATLRAIIDRDLPVVLGIIVLAAATFAIITVVVDILYRVVDPRLRDRADAS